MIIVSMDGGAGTGPDYTAHLNAGGHVLFVGGTNVPGSFDVYMATYLEHSFTGWHQSNCSDDYTPVGNHRLNRYLSAHDLANNDSSYHMLHFPNVPASADQVNLGETCEGTPGGVYTIRTYPSGGTFTYMALDVGQYDGAGTSTDFVQPFLRGYLEYVRNATQP